MRSHRMETSDKETNTCRKHVHISPVLVVVVSHSYHRHSTRCCCCCCCCNCRRPGTKLVVLVFSTFPRQPIVSAAVAETNRVSTNGCRLKFRAGEQKHARDHRSKNGCFQQKPSPPTIDCWPGSEKIEPDLLHFTPYWTKNLELRNRKLRAFL